MRKYFTLFVLLLLSHRGFTANITIIQSTNTLWTSDVNWQNVAIGMGHNAVIVPESTLDNTAFFATTDVLITTVYDHVYTAARINNIIAFMQTGKSVYIQSEYDLSFNGNQAYQTIANMLGGSFSWIGTVAGTLAPMNVLGTLATNPNIVPPLSYFWYGCNANVCNYFESFLEYQGDYLAFTFCPPAAGTGRLMTTSDQDWIIQLTSTDLMENMITLLLMPPSNCGFSSSTISLGNDTTLCLGDHLLLGSGISATSYLWSTGATSNVILVDSTATYWLQITSAGCTATDTINVVFNPCSISANFITNDPTICPGTCTDFTNLSVNATSYQWFFPGANPSISTDPNPFVICYNTPGSYDVTLIATDGNLIDTLVISNCVTVYPYPPAQGIAQSGDTLIANQGSVSYQWYHDGNLISGATDYFYVAQEGGNYNVVCTDSNGCEVEAVIFDVIAGIGETIGADNGIEFYPNPVHDFLSVNIPGISSNQILSVSIFNLLGETIFTSTSMPSRQIDCRRLPAGVYILQVRTTFSNRAARITVMHN